MHTVLTGRACPTQERFYFLDRLQPGNPAHVVGFALRLEGALHPEVLAEAVHRTVARHDVLRTSYTVEDGLVMQHVRPDSDAAVDVRSSRSSDRESQERELRELVADQAGQPFSLEEGPILRAFIRSWNPDEHGLVVLVHHIACDGWANPILMSDIAAYYNAAVTGPGETAGPAGTAPSHFAYSQAQRDVRNRGGIDFWRKTLQDAPHLSLHTDFPRPSELSDQGALVRLPVEPELIRQLTEWATGRGVTFFAVVLAAYASVLSRYARQDRVVIGVPVANRLNTDEEGLVGCLANTLPVLVDLTGSPPFADLLSRVWTAWLNAFGHQDVPFDLIVQAVQADRQLSQLPVFQTALNVLNYPFSLPDFDGLDVTEVDVQIEAAGFDVAITVDLCAATPFLRLDYRPELFEPPTAATMLSHYLAFLRSIVADAGAEPTMVNEAERDCLLVAANPPAAVGEPAQPSVLARFGEWARTSPDAVAIRHRGRDTTYRELDEWSSRIAAALLDAGVSGGDLVGLLLRRSPAVIASILGAWKAGAAYVPLDPEYPPYRLNLMVGSVGLTAMLAEAETADMARGLTGNQAVDLINVREISSQSEVPAACPAAGDLAYVMYTSGSTGTPKGVRVRHAGLSALYSPTPAGLDITASDVWLCTHSFSFDASVWATLGALTTGGRLVIAGYAQQADPARLAALVQTEKVTVLDATSGILYRLLPPYLDLLGGDVSPIRYVTTGGEALSWSRLAALVASTENFQPVFVNLYGLTECTIITTACQVAAKDLASVRDGTIGLPVPSARCYVLDNRLRRPAAMCPANSTSVVLASATAT